MSLHHNATSRHVRASTAPNGTDPADIVCGDPENLNPLSDALADLDRADPAFQFIILELMARARNGMPPDNEQIREAITDARRKWEQRDTP